MSSIAPHRATLTALAPLLVGNAREGVFADATAFSGRSVQQVLHQAVSGALAGPRNARMLLVAMPEIVLIAALDRHRAIGKDGRLPWHLPDDLKAFKAYTMGKPILMGRKTAQSLGRALPGRLNLVLTRSGEVPIEGMRAVRTVAEAISVAEAEGAAVLCVIGGGEVYVATLPIATRLRITHVEGDVDEPDTYFPPVDRPAWTAVSWDEHGADAAHPYPFTVVEYIRAQTGSGGSTEIT